MSDDVIVVSRACAKWLNLSSFLYLILYAFIKTVANYQFYSVYIFKTL